MLPHRNGFDCAETPLPEKSPKKYEKKPALFGPEIYPSLGDFKEQLRALLKTAKTARQGDFSVRAPVDQEGIVSEIGDVFNDILEMNETMAKEFIRIRKMVGLEGKMTERVSVGSVKGSWGISVDS